MSARVRPGPPMPDSSYSWEVVVGEGQMTIILAMRFDRAEADAFADGWNLAARDRAVSSVSSPDPDTG